MKYYVDSSFLLAAIFEESPEIDIKSLAGKIYTSRLTQVEVIRSVTKKNEALINFATNILSTLEFIELTRPILDWASSYPKNITLKSSDAIHLATAEKLLEKSDFLITLDQQMKRNAELLGIAILPTSYR